jgi:hypothetical protein
MRILFYVITALLFSATASQAQQCNITASTCSGAVAQCKALIVQYGYKNVNCGSIGAKCKKSGGQWTTRACNLKLRPA